MYHYAGIDVSVEESSVCVVDGSGRIVREAKVASDPEALVRFLESCGVEITRVGLEAGPLSQWLHAGLSEAGFSVVLLETRLVKRVLSARPVKTDRSDARGIAELLRLGWFQAVHCKSASAQEQRALLSARKLLQSKLHDVEMSLRGLLRGFGLKVGKTTRRSFEGRVRELVAAHAGLQRIAEALLSARGVLLREFAVLDRQVHAVARADGRVRQLMTTPGVGALVALTFVAAIDDPRRFRSSKMVGAHFGLTPKRDQSGERDVSGRISKIGDSTVRCALYEAANVILTRPVRGSALKRWGLAVARRAGMRKAKVAVARKLAVILHRMWIDGTAFDPCRATKPAAMAI